MFLFMELVLSGSFHCDEMFHRNSLRGLARCWLTPIAKAVITAQRLILTSCAAIALRNGNAPAAMASASRS